MWARAGAFIERRAVWIAVVLAALGTARIALTYTVFNHTIDEPAHIACGMEWLEKGTYTYEAQHPPLARVMAAAVAKLGGARGWGRPGMYNEGAAILYGQGAYDKTLALARAGILPFFWLACTVVYLMARWAGGTREAMAAVFLFTMTPPVLAHAGLATTDMALTATLLAALYASWRWAESPTWGRSALFGVGAGLAVLSKFTSLAYLPAVSGAALAAWWWSDRPGIRDAGQMVLRRALPLLTAMLVAAIVVWAGFRFSVGQVEQWSLTLPAPELFRGILEAQKHNAEGHATYLLGQWSMTGWAHYYFVALAVKTPLPLLGLALAGLWLMPRRGAARTWMPLSIVVGILLFASFYSKINIGTRHVLPVFAGFAAAGGVAAVSLLEREKRWARWTLGAGVLWMLATSLAAHPDYLPYFNALGGSKPEEILVDSDLDWGQDMKRLGRRLRELGAQEVAFDPFIVAHLEAVHGFPRIVALDPQGPRPGWNAVSLTVLKLDRFGMREKAPAGVKFWPEAMTPAERVGAGVLLFYQPRSAR